MSTNELNIFLESFDKPVNYSSQAWNQVLNQSREIWNAFIHGENWQKQLDITCKEAYLMLVNKDGKLIVSDESLLNYLKNEHVKSWKHRVEEIAFKAIRDKKYEIAERYFGKVIKLEKDNAMNHYRRALVRLKLSNHKGALLDISEAIRLRPEVPSFYGKRAEIYRLLDLDHKAMSDLNMAIRLNPSNAEMFELRGKFRMSLGDRAGGRLDLLNAEELKSKGEIGGNEQYGLKAA
jgi:tetratricopeptide (TPR) repeat protein